MKPDPSSPKSCRRQRTRSRGFSLIELMVAVAVSLVLTLAVASVLMRNEGGRRNTLAVDDVNQSGAYAAYLLDNALRSAGSGFANRGNDISGCRINAVRSSATILPRTAAWPAPFAGFSQEIRLAPVLIGKGQSAAGSDVIAVMRGNAGGGETAFDARWGAELEPVNTIGIVANQLLLLAWGPDDCFLVQAGPPAGLMVPFAGAGSYHNTPDLASAGAPATLFAVNLGNAGPAGGTPTNAPQFTLYGVGANRTLFALDMLAITDAGAPQPIVEGVVELRGLYGVDNDGDGVQDVWVDPGVAPFDTASLLDGSPTANRNLNRIVALRIGFVLRTARAEREVVAPASLVLFSDLDVSLRQTRNLSAEEQNFRHRAVEVTVPLRNVLLASAP